MRNFNVYYIVTFILFTTISLVKAQLPSESLFVNKVTNKTTEQSLNLQQRASALFNGKVHNPHIRFKDGRHAFFINEKYSIGSVTLNNITYNEVSLMYDIVRDELLLLSIDQTNGIVLNPQNVNSFTLHQHHFINIKHAQKGFSAGYYDLIYNGQTSLLVKREKQVTEKIEQRIEKVINEKTSYFLLKDSVYHPVKSKQDLLKLIYSTHSENLAYIKAKKLNFKKDMANAMVSLVNFHDSFNK